MNGMVIKQGLLSLTIFRTSSMSHQELPLFAPTTRAIKASSCGDYVEQKLDLNHFLVRNPASTFCVRVKGVSMESAGIYNEDLLIVDRGAEPKNNDIAVCVINGEFMVKRFKKDQGILYVIPDNPDQSPIRVAEGNNFQVMGVVSYVIHKTK